LKLAILADIHGNLQALEATLKDIKQENPDSIIVNGDLVNRGPNNDLVMQTLWNERASNNLSITLGNHDDLIRKWIDKDDDLPQTWFSDPFWTATDWVVKQLERSNWIDELRTLPMEYRPEILNADSVLVTHGSPRHYREGYSERTPETDVVDIAKAFPADIFVGSHTHSPLDRQVANYRLFNTGAIGSPFNGDPRAQYLMLHLENGIWQPEFRQVSYDLSKAIQAYSDTGMLEEGGLSAFIFKEEVRHARSLFTPFFMWAEKEGIETSWETWERFKEAFPERVAALKAFA